MSVEAIGDSIARRYRIIEKIGSGGMGSVYKALDTRLQRLIALKVLHFAHNPEAKPLFLREAGALARLRHPNVVEIYDVGETETLVYMAIQYIEGRTLDQILAGAKPLDPDYAIEIICQVGMALSYAHQRGVIHRDVKPSNILISNDGRVRLSDFGLATAPRAPTLTQTGTIAGTPAYMSPEQAMGKLVDGRSDIFSLGVVLYEVLTGTQPFVGSSTVEVFRKLCEEAPTAPQEINPSVPSSIAEVVLKSLAKQPEQRFQTVDEFLSALIEANPRRAPSLSRQRLRGQERENENFPEFIGDSFEGAAKTAGKMSPTMEGRLSASPLLLLAAGRRLRSRVLAAALAVSILLLLSFVSVLTRKSLPVGSGSSSTTSESWFSHYGLGLLAVAGAALVLWFVWRLYERTGLRQAKVVPSPTVSTSSAGLDLGVAVQADQAQQIGLDEMILQGGVGDCDPTATELLPYHPAPSTRRQQAMVQQARLSREELAHYPSAIAWLLVHEGAFPEREFRLTGKVTIGRQVDSEIVIADPGVSRQHACISLENARFYITDLGSRHGTFVNGERVQERELSDRDEITVGGTLLVFTESLIPGVNRPSVQMKLQRVQDDSLAEAKRLQEFNAIWDQLTNSARHA